jgi:hypothetical protein
VRYVKEKEKKVEAYHFEANVSLDLAKACNINITIDRKTVNKFFYRQSTKLGDIVTIKKKKK